MIKKYQNDLASITSQDALDFLKDGNLRFVNGLTFNKDLKAKVAITAKGQQPFAAVLSCMDSRVPVELIFDQGFGDLFSIRMAGNISSAGVLGSLEYATAAVGSKLILVLGHTHCGAVKGAISKVELGNLTGLLDKIQPAVKAACIDGIDCNADNKSYVDSVAEQNVRNVIQTILSDSPTISGLIKEGKIIIAGAMYDVESGNVTFLDEKVLA